VGVAALLIAFCLAGAQLYSSSSGSAALDTQLDETCRSSSALTLPIPPDTAGAEQRVAEIGAAVPLVEPARRWASVSPFLSASTAPRRLTLLYIDEIDRNVTPALAPLADGEIAMMDSILLELAADVGEVIDVSGARLMVTQRFDDPPGDPIPSYWCRFPDLLVPPPSGDFRPLWAIASLETIAAFGAEAEVFDEYRVVDEPLTLTDAEAIQRGYRTAIEQWSRSFPRAPVGVDRNELERVIGRAVAVRVTVDRNLAPVTLTGIVAGAIVLVAAGVLLARDRQRELRLLAVRGMPPSRIAAHAAPRLAAAIAIGSLLGWLIAWAVISVFGPSSNLEASALARSVVWVVAAAASALVLVAGVVGYVGDGFADARRRRVHHRWAAVAVAASAVALAAVGFRELDREGGVRTFGVESRGGGLLAMGFPLFALLAATAIGGWIVAVAAPRLRLSGGSLRRSIRLGWRRVVLEAGPLVAVVVSAGLATGCFTTASALAKGSERQLADKAEVYVGADLAIDVYDPVDIPASWEPRTTLISKTRVKWGETRAELVGIDQARFADVARLRADGSSLSLNELVSEISTGAADRELTAIAVGADVAIGDVLSVEVPGNTEMVPVTIAATADFFPGKTTQVPMLVVTRDGADDVSPFSRSALLIRDPPADAVTTIRESGVRTGVVLDATRAFDGSAYSALRWAYAPLATLGLLFAVVALALQLLVVSARRSQRRVADAVMRRTGFTTRGLWWASIVETGVPLVVGSAIGVGAAMAAASLSIVRLDPMPALAPPAEFAVPWDVVVATACVVPVWTAVIAFVIVRSTTRVDPMRVFQGAA
jgi:hypothetical protein